MYDMNVYVFGNPDVACDAAPFTILQKLIQDFPQLNFVVIQPNEDLPFIGEENPLLLDTIYGISQPAVFSEGYLDAIRLSTSSSAHDFDLGFQLKYLKKIGKITHFSLIGIPAEKEINYDLIHSILRKLVAHDMHGS